MVKLTEASVHFQSLHVATLLEFNAQAHLVIDVFTGVFTHKDYDKKLEQSVDKAVQLAENIQVDFLEQAVFV